MTDRKIKDENEGSDALGDRSKTSAGPSAVSPSAATQEQPAREDAAPVPVAPPPQSYPNEDDDWNDDEPEGEVFGYECLGCGNVQASYHNGECDKCCAYAIEPMYE